MKKILGGTVLIALWLWIGWWPMSLLMEADPDESRGPLLGLSTLSVVILVASIALLVSGIRGYTRPGGRAQSE